MKVIFLDIDGVLNSDEYFKKIKGKKIEGIENEVDIEKIKLLKKAVVATRAKVVLISSWRNKENGILLKQLLMQYGILADSTPFIESERGKEIKQWLANHPATEDYVILDDEIFDSYDDILIKKLIKISNGNGINYGEGLQQKNIETIINRFERNKLFYDKELDR